MNRNYRSEAHARHVAIPSDGAFIRGDLTIPPDACGVVLFAHGSGSGRLSERNRFVAKSLNALSLATLLIDLLTEEEEQEERFTEHHRFDIGLLADRLQSASRYLADDPAIAALGLGYFGASTGAAAALVGAVANAPLVKAVVSRGGRPDLAGDALPRVEAPTLLLVGSNDAAVVDLNRKALQQLPCKKELVVIPGATHLFEEPGKLEEVARLAGGWFTRHLCARRKTP